jgi:competence protein ComEC
MNTRPPVRFAFVLCLLLLCVWSSQAQITAHYINVGQADSILLEFKTAAILIDAGGEDTGDTRDVDHLLAYLNEFFQRRTDLNRTLYSVIISHPHIDHTKNLMAIFNKQNKFKVLNFTEGGQTGSASGMPPLIKARTFVKTNHILYNVIKDSKIGPNGYTTSHLLALKTSASLVDVRFLGGARGCDNENNDSLVMLVKHKEGAYLFTGDAETTNESDCKSEIAKMVESYKANHLLDVDVYKVGHHGSHNGTSKALMQAMTPQISVISAGDLETRTPDRFHAFQFGHPREEAFLLLQGFTSGTRPQKHVYAMDAAGVPFAGSGNPPGKPVFRDITEAVFCTCWDKDIRVHYDEQTKFKVETGPQ